MHEDCRNMGLGSGLSPLVRVYLYVLYERVSKRSCGPIHMNQRSVYLYIVHRSTRGKCEMQTRKSMLCGVLYSSFAFDRVVVFGCVDDVLMCTFRCRTTTLTHHRATPRWSIILNTYTALSTQGGEECGRVMRGWVASS